MICLSIAHSRHQQRLASAGIQALSINTYEAAALILSVSKLDHADRNRHHLGTGLPGLRMILYLGITELDR